MSADKYRDEERFVMGKIADSISVKMRETLEMMLNLSVEIDERYAEASDKVIAEMSILKRATAIKEFISDMRDHAGFSEFATIFKDTFYRNGVDYQVRRICDIFDLLDDGIRFEHIALDYIIGDIIMAFMKCR